MATLNRAEIRALLKKANLRKKGDLTKMLYDDLLGVLSEDYDLEDFTETLQDGNYGEYFQITFGDTWLNIGIGQSVKLTAKGEARIDELLDNYQLYCSEYDKKGNLLDYPWFSFGAEGDPEKNKIASRLYSLAQEEEQAPLPEPKPKRRTASAK